MKPQVLVCMFSMLVLFGGSSLCEAQTWAKMFGGSAVEFADVILHTATGEFLVAGTTSTFGAGNEEAWVVKLDAFGNIVWEKAFGNADSDQFYSAVEAQNGDFVLVGYKQLFAPADLWAVRINSAGGIQWERTFGGIDSDFGQSVNETSGQDLLIAGCTRSYGAGSEDMWVMKLTATGAPIWQETFGGAGADCGTSVEEISGGDVIVAGTTGSFGAGGLDLWVMRLTSAGAPIWQIAYGGSGDDGMSTSPGSVFPRLGTIHEVPISSGFILAGHTSSFGAGGVDAWVLKLNGAGVIEWQMTYGTGTLDMAAEVIETTVGGYIFGGLESGGGFWGIRLNATGGIEWQRRYAPGVIILEGARGVDLADAGGFVLAGGNLANDINFMVVKVDKNGESDPSCPFVDTTVVPSASSALATPLSVSPSPTTDLGSASTSIVTNTNAVATTICSSPTIQDGSSYCITGVSTGANYAWFVDLNQNGSIDTGEPVDNNVVNPVPPGQNGTDLAAAFAASIAGNANSVATGTVATVSSQLNCFDIAVTGLCVAGLCIAGNLGGACTVDSDCVVPPELYVGPPGSPDQCHVTSTACAYNPLIVKVDPNALATIPTLTEWGIVAVTVLLMGGAILVSRRGRLRIPNRH